MNRTLLILVATTLCVACGGSQQGQTHSTPPTYQADIRWTSYGIPHVKADDWAGLGYGFAYATATDAVCVIARDVAMVNGELARYLGSAEGNLESDIFHKAILTSAKLTAYNAAQSKRAIEFSSGYVAGYNRYLADHAGALPESCKAAAWVRPISVDDLNRLAMGVGIRYGLGRFQKEIAAAGPEPDATPIASTQYELPPGIGSNAVAVGSALSASGRGILLGNPHYPWHGSSRFHLIHTTIPGEVDVMGTSLLNTSRVAIGFNKDIAWTHTVSTALRFTLYQLELNPDNPREYRYDDGFRTIETRRVQVEVENAEGKLETVERDVSFAHYGPIIENKEFPWSAIHAYALRDAVLDNYLTADTYDALNKASSTSEIEAAISQQGVYWTNTVAADRHGNTLYADISATPNVDSSLLDACRVSVKDAPARLVILNGTTAACEWREDPRSKVPGALPAQDMPRLTRSDYVTNSNDSYWLSNPAAPLEGYSPIIGSERSARSLRTRAGLNLMKEMIAANEKLEPSDIQNMLYNHRNYGAELLLDDVLKVCQNDEAIAPACTVLASWNRTMTTTSTGGHVWREFWDQARHIDNLYAQSFDADDPVNTPAGINFADTAVSQAVKDALVAAQTTLGAAGVALDAPLSEIQYAERNGRKIPIPGGEGWAGMFSMTVTRLQTEKGYTPIIHGNSYIQVISWDEEGQLNPTAMLTYSQSPEPESAHYSDLTELYASGGWIDLPFTDQEIEADPNLTRLKLAE